MCFVQADGWWCFIQHVPTHYLPTYLSTYPLIFFSLSFSLCINLFFLFLQATVNASEIIWLWLNVIYLYIGIDILDIDRNRYRYAWHRRRTKPRLSCQRPDARNLARKMRLIWTMEGNEWQTQHISNRYLEGYVWKDVQNHPAETGICLKSHEYLVTELKQVLRSSNFKPYACFRSLVPHPVLSIRQMYIVIHLGRSLSRCEIKCHLRANTMYSLRVIQANFCP